MYEPPRADDRPGCRDVWVLTRATWLALLPLGFVLVALIAVLGVTIVLFAIHPALALIPVAGVAVAVAIYARWERTRSRPPDSRPPPDL